MSNVTVQLGYLLLFLTKFLFNTLVGKMFREYYLMGFNQFMLLDFAADYTVKHAGQIRRLDSISFMDSNSKWNMMVLS